MKTGYTKRYRHSSRRASDRHSAGAIPRPKSSFGVVIFDHTFRVLLVQRRDSFGYLTCIDNSALGHDNVADTLATITVDEKEKLMRWDWERLWQSINLGAVPKDYKEQCQARFEWLCVRDTVAAMDRRGEKWQPSNAWGLPKGRMAWKDNETAIRCATREMQEETGISPNAVAIIPSKTFRETYTGTDGRAYTSVYYAGRLVGNPDEDAQEPDSKEIREVVWATVKECEEDYSLRPELLEVIREALHSLKGGSHDSRDHER